MHELSLSSAIVDTVLRHADGRKVSVVSMRIGSLRQVVPESLLFYFEIVGRDTVCDGARLDLELLGALMHCDSCGSEWDPAPPPLEFDPSGVLAPAAGGLPGIPSFRCPDCGQGSDHVLRGDEFEVESIDVETPEPAGRPTH